MKNYIIKTTGYLIIGTLSLIPFSSNAAIIATENFDYPDSTSLATVGSGGTGWSGNWTTDGTSFNVVDGAAYTGDLDAFRNSRTLSTSQSTGTLYFAWTGVKQRTQDINETQVLALSGMDGGTEEFSLQFRTDGSDVDNEYFLLYGGSDSSTGSDSGGLYTEGSQYTLVLELNFNTGGEETISAWAFSGGLPTTLGSALLTTSAPVNSIDSILLQSNGKRMTGSLDNIVIATEYSDIVSAIPEPSTYATLFGICAMTFAMIRRRHA